MSENSNPIRKNMMQPNSRQFNAFKEYVLDPASLKKNAFGTLATESLIDKVHRNHMAAGSIDLIPKPDSDSKTLQNYIDQLWQNHINVLALEILTHQFLDQLHDQSSNLKFIELKQITERFSLAYSEVPKNDLKNERRFLNLLASTAIFEEIEDILGKKNDPSPSSPPKPAPIPANSENNGLTIKLSRKGLSNSGFQSDRSLLILHVGGQKIEIDLSKNSISIAKSLSQALSVLILNGTNLIASILPLIDYNQDESKAAFDSVVDFLYPPHRIIMPKLFLVDEFKLQTFLGERGIGPNIYNEHLGPNSSKEIMIKMTETIREKLDKSYNIFDSDSEVAERRFEEQLESEVNQSDSASLELSEYLDIDKTHSSTFGGSFNASISIGGGNNNNSGNSDTQKPPRFKLLSAGASINLNGSVTDSENTSAGTSSSSNITRDNAIRNLANALNTHAVTSSRNREITVTSVTETTTEFQKLESQIETIRNENPDRILIYLVHAMLQEFITVLTLNTVYLLYFNGYEFKKVQLPELESFFSEIILDSRNDIKDFLYREIRKSLKILDYQDRVIDLHEYNGVYNRCSKQHYFMLLKSQNQQLTDSDNQIKPFEHDLSGVVVYVDKFTVKQPGVIKMAILSDTCLSDLKLGEYKAKIEKMVMENKKIESEIKRYDEMLKFCSSIDSSSAVEYLKANSMFKLIKPNQEIVDKTVIAHLIGSNPKKSRIF